MATILSELHYNENHLWLREDSPGIFLVGLSDFAQSELGDIHYMELPEEGDEVITGDDCGSTESDKSTIELFAPISGEIVEINTELADSPSLVNSDPYYDGWLYKIEASDESEIEELLDSEAYEELLPESETSYENYEDELEE